MGYISEPNRYHLPQVRGIEPLKLDTITLQHTLASNIDAHVQAILEEH